jgi:hypothetical protein
VVDRRAPIFVVFLQPSHDLHSEVLRRSLESALHLELNEDQKAIQAAAHHFAQNEIKPIAAT